MPNLIELTDRQKTDIRLINAVFKNALDTFEAQETNEAATLNRLVIHERAESNYRSNLCKILRPDSPWSLGPQAHSIDVKDQIGHFLMTVPISDRNLRKEMDALIVRSRAVQESLQEVRALTSEQKPEFKTINERFNREMDAIEANPQIGQDSQLDSHWINHLKYSLDICKLIKPDDPSWNIPVNRQNQTMLVLKTAGLLALNNSFGDADIDKVHKETLIRSASVVDKLSQRVAAGTGIRR
jgi:hypothetical protein